MNSERIKKLNNFAFPLLVQSIMGYFIGFTDQAIVARISTPALAAVGVVSSFLQMIAGLMGAITLIFNIRGSKKIGAKDDEGLKKEFFSSLLLSLILGVAFIILFILGRASLLSSVYALSGQTYNQAIIYSDSMSLYVLIQLFLFAFGTYFKIHNNTKWILIGSTTSSIVNLILDYIFVLGKFGMPKLGVNMAGISTVIAMSINLMIYAIVLREQLSIEFLNIRKYFKNAIIQLKESLPLMGQEILDGSIFVVIVNAIILRMGTFEYAGYIIINMLLGFLNIAKYMYGSATLTLTGISYGEKNKEDLKAYPKISTKIITAIYIVLGVVFILTRNYVPAIVSDDVSTQKIVSLFLAYFIIANSVSPFTNTYMNALQALGLNVFILYSTAIINTFILLLMFVSTSIFNMSLYGIALCVLLDNILTGIVYYKRYNKEIAKDKEFV
ncbi:MATE family efflux transporter [Tissierella sp. MB52-C2]|uniref:MATE family efflux transporter n=1 Tax=Tissierella sp. MB52-C2 TaxID=3070999 RepID=UPI00280C31E7|nr:MATE family efflux transporter [Tissierella sp. MB52-C2]WMM25006.1 MATE family efflux transporter [Tissierella sp. MB52-C2]